MKKKLIVNLTLLCSVSLICFVLGEACFRYQYRSLNDRMKHVEQLFRKSEVPGLIYEYIPGIGEINSHGFRDVEHSYATRKGVFRIVVIGDSVAEGVTINPAKTFSRQLERMLNDRSSLEFEVISLAVQGYSLQQEVALLEHKALKYQPDMIIWAYCLNDPAHPVFHNYNAGLGRYFSRPRLHLVLQIERGWFLLKELAAGVIIKQEIHRVFHRVYFDEIDAGLGRIGACCRENAIDLRFAILPLLECKKLETDDQYRVSAEQYEFNDIDQQLINCAARHQLQALTLVRALDGQKLKSVMLSADDPWHLNARGHLLLARYLATYLRQEGITVR